MLLFAKFITAFTLFSLATCATEIPDYEEFVDLICQETSILESALCMAKLPKKGKDIINECSRNLGVEINDDDMRKAVKAYCYKADIRNDLLLCYENELSSFYETIATSKEKLQMDEFQLCLQIVVDKLLEEK